MYTVDGTSDETVTVLDGDVYLVGQGYHGPSTAQPEYPMYFLNVLAGPGAERTMGFCDDPDHHWIRDTWADSGPGPAAADDLGRGTGGPMRPQIRIAVLGLGLDGAGALALGAPHPHATSPNAPSTLASSCAPTRWPSAAARPSRTSASSGRSRTGARPSPPPTWMPSG